MTTTTSPGRDRTAGAPRRAGWQPLAGVGLLAAVIVVLDQISKAWIVGALGRAAATHTQPIVAGVLDLHYVENTGASFGLFQNGGWVLAAVAAAVIVVILVLVPRLHARPEGVPWPLLTALGLVLGGALGNLIDRVRLGYVVDFVTPTFARVTVGDTIYQFPTFNVADSGITIGVLLLLVTLFFTGDGGRPAGSDAASPGGAPQEAPMADSDQPVRLARQPGSGTTPLTPLGLGGCLVLVGGLWVWAVVRALQARKRG